MKSLASLWKRRWCRVCGFIALACAIPLLHPFIRQSIFGPTIDGIPWCVWEDEIRAAADPAVRRQSWFRELLAKLGLSEERRIGNDPNIQLLPVYLHLANDCDVNVRRRALWQLADWCPKREDLVPPLQRHLDDPDPQCRLCAIAAVWEKSKNPAQMQALLALKDHEDMEVQYFARNILCNMARFDVTLFDHVAKLAEDPNPSMRFQAVQAMQHFGKKSVPVLQRAFEDKGQGVRNIAVRSAGLLGNDGRDLIPPLQALQHDPDPILRSQVEEALHGIDPMRFAKPADLVE